MENKTPSKFIEIEIQPADLAVLTGAWSRPLGALSPLPPPGAGSPERGYRPVVFDAAGTLQEEVYELLPVLASPESAVGLAAVTPQGTLDMMIFHTRDRSRAALTRADQKLWLQYPAPLPVALATLEQGLVEPQGALPHFDLDLTIAEAFALWAFLDIVRKGDPSASTARITTAALRQAMDLPLHGTDNLAAYYRDCLLLPLPGEEELNQACLALVEKEWVARIGNDYLPGEPLWAVAKGMGAIPWHVLARLGITVAAGEAAGIQVRLMQSAAGLCLGWYEFEERVHLWTMDKNGVMNLLQNLLLDPGAFFPRRAVEAATATAPAVQKAAPAAPQAATPLPAALLPESSPQRKRSPWLTCGLIGLGITGLLCIGGVLAVFITGMLGNPEAQASPTQASPTQASPAQAGTSPTLNPTAPATRVARIPVQLYEQHNFYVDTSGGVHLVGRLVNEGDQPVTATLNASLLDADGQVLDTSILYMWPELIPPGAIVPYDINYWEAVSYNLATQQKVDSYSISVDPDYYEVPERTAVEIAVTDGEWEIANGTLIFHGTVMVPATGGPYLYVIGSVTDAAGNPLAVANTMLEATSAGSVPFDCNIALPEGFDPTGLTFTIQAFLIGE